MNSNVLDWIEQRRYKSDQTCIPIPWEQMRLWEITDGKIVHTTRRFFSIIGVQVISNLPALNGTEQPIIHQPEIGILGIMLCVQEDENLILAQAKAEPGNVGVVQIAPTVQATVSNYTQVHGGLPTPYLEYFLNGQGETISDSMQSEHGGHFMRKYNRNIIKQMNDTFPDPASEFWQWIPLNSVLELLLEDFTINTDGRSVLASGDWHRLSGCRQPFERGSSIDNFGRRLRQSFTASVEQTQWNLNRIERLLKKWRKETRIVLNPKPIEALEGWTLDDRALAGISIDDGVKPYRVKVTGREVPEWDQPLFCSEAVAEVFLFCQVRSGILCFLMHEKVEIGFQEFAQLGPSLHLRDRSIEPENDSLDQRLLQCAESGQRKLTCLQSDEGGRFYQSLCRYSVVQLEIETRVPEHDSLCWLSLSQIYRLIKTNGIFTNEARSAISLLLYYL